MRYVIFNKEKNNYVKCGGSWAASLQKASKFATLEKAENYMRNNFSHEFKAASADEVEIIDISSLINSVYKDKVIPVSSYLDEQSAAVELEKLHNFLSFAYDSAQAFASLPLFYEKMVEKCDLETIDILHKIELVNANVVDGWKLYKQLQEVRRRRREAKDALEFCSLLLTSGLIQSLKAAKTGMAELECEMEKRTYNPRVLKGLFDDKQSDGTM